MSLSRGIEDAVDEGRDRGMQKERSVADVTANGSRRGRLPEIGAPIVRGLIENHEMPIADGARRVNLDIRTSKILTRHLPS
jgi:hypothetical protein